MVYIKNNYKLKRRRKKKTHYIKKDEEHVFETTKSNAKKKQWKDKLLSEKQINAWPSHEMYWRKTAKKLTWKWLTLGEWKKKTGGFLAVTLEINYEKPKI